jgi:SOS-response transcriptional repressor LexA
MEGVGILNGDTVVIHLTKRAVVGNYVVVWDGADSIVKELAEDENSAYLNSHNADKKKFPDIRLTDDFRPQECNWLVP